jgi:hypothetical protein
MDRSRERLTADRSRCLAPGRSARDARRGRNGRCRRTAPEHWTATPRAAPRHVRGFWAAARLGAAPRLGAAAGLAAAAGPREAADPLGTGSLDGSPWSRGAGRLDGSPWSRGAGSLEGQRGSLGAGRRRAAGPPRLASSAPGRTWAAGPGDQFGPVAPNQCPHPGPGALRPGIRAMAARYPCVPSRAARSADREMRRAPSAAGTSPEHLGIPGLAFSPGQWSPGQCRSRGIVPCRPRSVGCARRGERRSDHPPNTRSSGPAPVPVPGLIPGTPPPGTGDRRGGGATWSG